MAIGGSVLLLASACMFYLEKPDLLLLVLYLLSLAAAVYALVRFAQWRVRSVERKSLVPEALLPHAMVGRAAKTSTDLTPVGHICIDDQFYPALSESGPIEKGTEVIVIGEKGAQLIVAIPQNQNLSP